MNVWDIVLTGLLAAAAAGAAVTAVRRKRKGGCGCGCEGCTGEKCPGQKK